MNCFITRNHKKSINHGHGGFTLIEFIVIISIFAIMAAVALFNFTGFRNDVGLNNLAHDIALEIRQAQVFGWSTLGADNQSGVVLDSVTGNPVHVVQGVYFPYDAGSNSYAHSFILYTKAIGATTNSFDPNSTADTTVDTIVIQGTNKIEAIAYAATSSDLKIVNHTVPTSGIDVVTAPANDGVSLSFSRPQPEAVFDSMQQAVQPTDSYMGIYIAAASDPIVAGTIPADHVVIVSRFGEIEVQ